MNTLKSRVGELSPEKLKALNALLAAGKNKVRPASITRADPGRTTFPLSFSQERLWFFEQIFPGTAVYNWPFAWSLGFAVDDAAARAMLDALVGRHELLRTTYRLVDNVPMQCVEPPAAAYVLFHDFCAEADPVSAVQASMVKYAQISFDLEHGPLCKFYFFRTGEDTTVIGGVMHHSVIDPGSRQTLIEDISRLFAAQSQPQVALPALPIHYGDYAAWQRQDFAADRQSPSLDYWTKQLDGLRKGNFPTDRARTDQSTFACGVEKIEFPPVLAEALRTFSRKQGVTLFTVLLAGFLVQLSRYGGERDIATAIPVAGRNREELQKLLGFFVNTLVIRETVDDALSFEQLVARVKQTLLDALSHQDVPFERIVEALSPARELSRSPFSDFMFQLQNVPRNAAAGLREIRIAPEATAFDIDIHLYEQESGDGRDGPPHLYGNLTYSQDLFDPATLRGFSGAYVAWLAAAVAMPEAPMRTLQALGRDDVARLDAWNDTYAPFRSEPPLLEAVAALAASRADAVAVQCDGEQLTYRQLDEQAERLAEHLHRRQVGPGAFVAVCAPRSTRLVVALLGVLKAGAAYIPLSPAFPHARLRASLDDAKPALLIAERAGSPHLFDGAVDAICLATDWNAIQDTDISLHKPNKVPASALAYRIYTSGSTGKPKGVDVRRDALDNVLQSVGAHCDIDASDAWLGVTSISFDIAALEIFLPLSIGARCVLANEADAADPERLQQLILDADVSVMQATPATWQMLVVADFQAGRRPLKIICGGEALPARLARELTARSEQVWNVYGPTETTIWSSIHRLGGDDGEIVPIGKPLANTSFHVLDEQLNRVPIGAQGGLFIAGAGLANGYAGQPALTAAQFVPDPFSKTPGARMYRTGDRVKLRQDGALVYLGRADSQTKIRGFRVEPDEIEACLLRLPDVAQAAVKVWASPQGGNQLHAYFKLRDAATPLAAEALRMHVGKSLPSYMVPAAFVELAQWPLTTNGKLDRAALPAVAQVDPSRPHEAAASATEIALARIWKKTLAHSTIGRHDSFFELGGNSLASVQMAYLAKEEGLTLRASDVFQAQTLAELAAAVDATAQRNAEAGLTHALSNTAIVLNTVPADTDFRDALFLVHPAGGDVMCYHALANASESPRPIVGLAFGAFPRTSDDPVTVERMAAWYIAEIRREFGVDPQHLGGWSFGAAVAFEMARQLRATDLAVANVLVIDQPAPGVDVVVDRPESAMADIIRRLELFFGRSIELDTIDMAAAPDDDLLGTILGRMKANDMFPGHLSPTAFRDFLAAYDVHMRAADAYRPGSYDGALTVLRAADPSPQGIFSSSEHPDRTIGWQDFCKLPVRVRPVPGHHLTVVAPPHAQQLAVEIDAALAG